MNKEENATRMYGWPVGLLLPSSGRMPPKEADPERKVERGKVDKRGDKEKLTKYVPPTWVLCGLRPAKRGVPSSFLFHLSNNTGGEFFFLCMCVSHFSFCASSSNLKFSSEFSSATLSCRIAISSSFIWLWSHVDVVKWFGEFQV